MSLITRHTALYSPLDIEYQQEYSGPYEDLSFRSEEVEIVSALKDGRITGFGRPVVCFGDDKLQKLHMERLWDTSKDIQYMDYLVDGYLSTASQFLLRHGYEAKPYYTQVINLSYGFARLHADVRKSYKSLINGVKRITFAADVSHLYELHIEAAGRETRSKNTWDIQQKMINEKQAFSLLMVNKAGVLIYHNNQWAYYAVAASLPGINTHALLWEAIVWCEAAGIKYFELGEQTFNGDKKLMDISKFKRGFGGKTVTRLLLEKKK